MLLPGTGLVSESEYTLAYILMIDDNPQTRKYVEKILHYRSQHELGFATSASEAVESMVQRRPDVIMLDLFIPGEFRRQKIQGATRGGGTEMLMCF